MFNLKIREALHSPVRTVGLLGIPALLIILLGTFAIYNSLTGAVDRTWQSRARTQASALSARLAGVLEGSLEDLAYLSANEADLAEFLKFMRTRLRQSSGRPRYCELVLLSADFEIFYRIFAVGSRVWMADGVQLADNASLLSLYKKSLSLKQGDVAVGPISSLEIGHPSDFSSRGKSRFAMLRLVTPIIHESKTRYLVLSLDLSSVKSSLGDTMSMVRDQGEGAGEGSYPYSYFLDTSGWVIFQASPSDDSPELTTHSVRVDTSGSLGRPGLPQAFLPAPEHKDYWEMVRNVNKGEAGVSFHPVRDTMGQGELFMEYHPLALALRANEDREVIGGLVFVDRIEHKGFWRTVLDNGGLIFGTWAVLMLLFTCYLESIRRTGLRIASALVGAESDPADLCPESRHSHIFGLLQQSAANLVLNFRKNKQLLADFMGVVAEYESKSAVNGGVCFTITKPLHDLERIVGDASSLVEIKDKLLVAASTELDVLIEGETGTGKQLVAEAIHRNSDRRDKEFVVINCAELDENLLLDTFFGHVPGAFTGADTERRGAFLTADGGTLLLDEIQSASLKTQQALLHVIAERRFRPLGSDREINVDIRLVGASNVNLREMVADGRFREDLYYRINVVYLYIPPLRERKNDIANLVNRFLAESGVRFHGAPRQISKGALNKLLAYDWPGNVRELKNCVFSAAALSTNAVLQAEDIVFGGSGFAAPSRSRWEEDAPSVALPAPQAPAPAFGGMACNQRQRQAAPFFLRSASFSRAEYQRAIGAKVSARTLNNDLNDLAGRNLLVRHYQGPATRYSLTEQGREFFQGLSEIGAAA